MVLLACGLKHSEWSTVELSAEENFPAIDSSQWSYPWYMVVYQGGFENTTSDTILPQDTVHLIHNSTCVLNRWPDTLPFCRAILINNALALEIYHEGADGYAGLKAWAFGRKFKYQYESSVPAFGKEPTKKQFEKQQLILNTDQWHKGTIVKGKVEAHWKRTFQNGKTVEESVKGNFEAMIE